jgi:hypothetical protein
MANKTRTILITSIAVAFGLGLITVATLALNGVIDIFDTYCVVKFVNYDGTILEEVVVNNTCSEVDTSILEAAFENCVNIKSIIFQGTLEKIHCKAFKGCSGLTFLSLPWYLWTRTISGTTYNIYSQKDALSQLVNPGITSNSSYWTKITATPLTLSLSEGSKSFTNADYIAKITNTNSFPISYQVYSNGRSHTGTLAANASTTVNFTSTKTGTQEVTAWIKIDGQVHTTSKDTIYVSLKPGGSQGGNVFIEQTPKD